MFVVEKPFTVINLYFYKGRNVICFLLNFLKFFFPFHKRFIFIQYLMIIRINSLFMLLNLITGTDITVYNKIFNLSLYKKRINIEHFERTFPLNISYESKLKISQLHFHLLFLKLLCQLSYRLWTSPHSNFDRSRFVYLIFLNIQ